MVRRPHGTVNSDIGVEALYAVWLKLPESGNYAIFSTYNSDIKNAYSSVGNVYCVELTDDFTMPVASGKRNTCIVIGVAMMAIFTMKGKRSALK